MLEEKKTPPENGGVWNFAYDKTNKKQRIPETV
jgi:hypothetical protein